VDATTENNVSGDRRTRRTALLCLLPPKPEAEVHSRVVFLIGFALFAANSIGIRSSAAARAVTD